MITIKIGGSVVDGLHPSTISDIKKISENEKLILVHGGGREVTKIEAIQNLRGRTEPGDISIQFLVQGKENLVGNQGAILSS